MVIHDEPPERLASVHRLTYWTECPCPSCGLRMPPTQGAISKRDGKTEICYECSLEENLDECCWPLEAG